MIILCQVSFTSYICILFIFDYCTCRYKVPNSATWHFPTCVTILDCPIKYFLYKMIFLITINVRPIWWDIFSVFVLFVIFNFTWNRILRATFFGFFLQSLITWHHEGNFLKTSCNFFPWNQFHEIIFKQYYVRTNCVKSIFIYIPQRTE